MCASFREGQEKIAALIKNNGSHFHVLEPDQEDLLIDETLLIEHDPSQEMEILRANWLS
jgi:hypothetical protein